MARFTLPKSEKPLEQLPSDVAHAQTRWDVTQRVEAK